MNRFLHVVANKTLDLLWERKALLHEDRKVFYVWQFAERVLVIFDTSMVDIGKLNDDFAHRLSTRLHGRKVVRTNTRGLFFQVDPSIPLAPRPLETMPLDLSQQPTPLHVPVGMTKDGPLWVPFLDGNSYLIGGIRDGGKGGEEHAWIQALLHGGQALVYAFDGKRGAELGRYTGRENFHFMMNDVNGLRKLTSMMESREKILTESGHANAVTYNAANQHMQLMMPIALFVDEAADLSDQGKTVLEFMIRKYRFTGLYPVVATNQPTVANLFGKTNFSTRISFRVPVESDSRVVLGYKGAEALPNVRGRGLILWNGKFVEFQSFVVDYPMPDPAAMRSILEEQVAAGSEAFVGLDQGSEDGDKTAVVLALAQEGLSPTRIVYKAWGSRSGSNFAERMELVKQILATAATATASKSPEMPLNGATAQ